jgi:exo-beta-1,3-glucanase (GH17 family)
MYKTYISMYNSNFLPFLISKNKVYMAVCAAVSGVVAVWVKYSFWVLQGVWYLSKPIY